MEKATYTNPHPRTQQCILNVFYQCRYIIIIFIINLLSAEFVPFLAFDISYSSFDGVRVPLLFQRFSDRSTLYNQSIRFI